MFHRWAASVLVLALCAMTPKIAAGQTSKTPQRHGVGTLGRNFPNPFNPETFIPFTVGDTTDNCANDRQQHAVTMRIVNILSQEVAIPILRGTSTTTSSAVSSGLDGSPLANLSMACGSYTAYWKGNVQNTGKEAASGTYIVLFSVDKTLQGTRRIFNAK